MGRWSVTPDTALRLADFLAKLAATIARESRICAPRRSFRSSHGRLRLMGIYIGTSGWAYPSWKPDFYPQKLPAKKFLEYYATQLNSVEVNFTFRSFPTETMLAGWLAAVGADFHFLLQGQSANHALCAAQELRRTDDGVLFCADSGFSGEAVGGRTFSIAAELQGRCRPPGRVSVERATCRCKAGL